jgi:hypothetical protein
MSSAWQNVLACLELRYNDLCSLTLHKQEYQFTYSPGYAYKQTVNTNKAREVSFDNNHTWL